MPGAALVRDLGEAPPPAEFFAALSRRPGAFLLDTALRAGHSYGQARWSFFGCDPALVLSARRDSVRLEGARPGAPAGEVTTRTWRQDPLGALDDRLREFGFSPEGGPRGRPEAPAPFTGGAVAMFGYDLKHRIERLAEPAPPRETDDLHVAFHPAIGAYDHDTGRLWLTARPLGGLSGRAAERELDRLERLVDGAVGGGPADKRPGRSSVNAATAPPPTDRSLLSRGVWRASFTPEGYRGAVVRLKERIAAGDIYQANLSQRFETDAAGEAWGLYRRLREASPAPYAAFLRCGELEILSASPEMFLRRRGDLVRTRPIKGTRPRGATPGEDERLRGELLASEKDRAELIMIVDLERNDLGRVCRTGGVTVPELVRLESYANVHHLVATVEGRLREGIRVRELLEATFPGGSITGAPKIRAMEILDGIEPTRRGPYTGAVGYIDLSGDLDLHVAIRTAYRLPGRTWFQAGGGIVADSDPAAEYEETLTKGRLLASVLASGRASEGGAASAGESP